MSFKTPLEERCFEIARQALGTPVKVEHNRRIQIESALFPAVAAFKGPPAKEVDVIAAELIDQPKVTLLISCKEFSKRAEPAHVQEWAAVVRTMNEYSAGTVYLGLVVSPTGFTAGCEAWATSHNMALIPPLKGRNLVFSGDAVFRMLERALVALRRRALLKVDDLFAAPAFFDFVYSVVSDFEGHEEVAQEGRYLAQPRGWVSSFGEMYASLAGHVVEDLTAETNGTTVWLSGGLGCRFAGTQGGIRNRHSARDRFTACSAMHQEHRGRTLHIRLRAIDCAWQPSDERRRLRRLSRVRFGRTPKPRPSCKRLPSDLHQKPDRPASFVR